MGIDFELLPVALALGAAALFGISVVIVKKGLAEVDAHTGSLVSMGTTVAIYLLSAPLWMRSQDWLSPGIWVFVAGGLMHPLLSMYLSFAATLRIGATASATFASTAPLFSTLTAIVFLDESITASLAAGTLATVCGVMTLSWSPRGITTLMRTALLCATGAAVIRGLNFTVGKWGLELLPNVFMAGFISFSVSFCGSLTVYRLRRGAAALGAPRSGLMWFVAAGAVITAAMLCMYSALLSGLVVVVSPIVNTYPLFTLLAALWVGQELLTRRLCSGVVMVVAGVVLISAGAAG